MLTLTIRTDRPEAEVGLFDGDTQLAYDVWLAHRALSVQLHTHIRQLLEGQHKKIEDLTSIVCFAGPGSFTGLRIGLTVGNALAYGLGIPVVGSQDPDWIHGAIARLRSGEKSLIALPVYGAPANITAPRK
jgi:tRNA threonylcarbamoyladenosine biosynthesis protein TsaB